MAAPGWQLPHLGLGLGLRQPHLGYVVQNQPAVDFFEVFPENYMYTEGHSLYLLEQVVARYALNFHCIGMSVGGCDPLDIGYLHRLRRLANRLGVVYISDHLCWTVNGGQNLHTILPMPYTEESLRHTAERVKRIQEFLGRPLFLENSPGYLAYAASQMAENEFLVRLCEATGGGILLDVNNLYQAAFNQDIDANAFVDSIPPAMIGYHHVAGHRNNGNHLLDTHDEPVLPAVWDLFARCEARTGGRTVLLEWDARVPPFEELIAEAAKARPLQASKPVHA